MKKTDIITKISFILFIFSTLLFIYRNLIGLVYLPFIDESGHFLGAIAVHHGDILYRDYIDAHGPLIFIASWLLGCLFGFSKVWLFRLVSTIFIGYAGFTIFQSTIFNLMWQRFLATCIWFTFISCVWTVQGLYLDSYWTVGGGLTVIALATIILPILYEYKVTKINAFVGGAVIGLLPLTAYTFSLVSVIFIFVILYHSFIKYHIYRNALLMSFLGCLIAILATIVWLLIYGDIGGMIAFHFVANQFYYAHYNTLTLSHFIQSLILGISPDRFIENIAVCSFFIGSVCLLISGKYKICNLIVISAILTLQLRGSISFQNGSFLTASFGIFALSFIKIMQNKPKLSIFISLCATALIIVLAKYATSAPFMLTTDQRKTVVQQFFGERPDISFVQDIQKYTKPDQRILVVPYNPDMYIYANRLPIKKYHAYLPWEADYAKYPWYGYDRDICVDLPKEKPTTIFFDNLIVWGYPAEKYMSCVMDFMNKEYTRMPNGSFVYVRNDLLNKK